MGPIRVEAHVDEVPGIGSIDPESCYLAWTIYLESAAERSAIDEVFEWVVDESGLVIEPLTSTPEAAKAETAAHAEKLRNRLLRQQMLLCLRQQLLHRLLRLRRRLRLRKCFPRHNLARMQLPARWWRTGSRQKAADSKKSEVSSIRVGNR